MSAPGSTILALDGATVDVAPLLRPEDVGGRTHKQFTTRARSGGYKWGINAGMSHENATLVAREAYRLSAIVFRETTASK